MRDIRTAGEIWACTDCLFAHHYGPDSIESAEWDRDTYESEITGLDLSDYSCTAHDGTAASECAECGRESDESGYSEFSRQSCELCRSSLGGSRFRMAVWETILD
jgi:hypothetical protein